MTTTTDHCRWLREWVAATTGCAMDRLDDSAALFVDGWLDSTDFVELLLAIEERCGETIKVSQITPDAFRSIDAILTHFFPETGHVDRAA